MIFVAVGSQKFQFNRLIHIVDRLVFEKKITDRVFAQIGHCDYIPQNIEWERFLDKDRFSEYLDNSSVVITHAGTGIIINALKKEKKIVAMARLSKYGEHVDDHQVQILELFSQAGLIEVARNEGDLFRAYKECLEGKYKKYKSNKERFMKDLDSWLESNC